MMNANKAREVYNAHFENLRKMAEESAKNFCENTLNDRILSASRDGELKIEVKIEEMDKAGASAGLVIHYLKSNDYDAYVSGSLVVIRW